MRRFVGLILFVIVSTACESGRTQDLYREAVMVPSVMDGSLTEEEYVEGWRVLFNGEDLSGWRGIGREDAPAGWTVTEEGDLYFTGRNGGDLITVDQYDDFELDLEWKISTRGNSGIFFRVDENRGVIYSPEYQIVDDAGFPGFIPSWLSGANFDVQASSTLVAVRPAGEWNQTRIIARGNHVEHWLNGQQVVSYEIGSDAWLNQVSNSKFREMPEYGHSSTGHIALQDHGNPVWFRNIRIRSLTP